MPTFLDDDQVIRRLIAWGERQPAVRALLLTSTRAVPGARLDSLSDYDVILVVDDIAPFLANRAWIADFGEVLVAYWDPVSPNPDTGVPCAGNIVQYADGLKIDFGLWPVAQLQALLARPALPPELDAGYRVLLNKDGKASALPAPTHVGYRVSPPDEATYLTLVNDFFIGVPYVAKCLLRDELLPGRWCLDFDMRYVYLLPMLEWRAASDTGWTLAPGVNGKGLKRYLAADAWAGLEATFAGSGIDETWDALFAMIALFGQVGREVGTSLGYAYPEDLDRRVTAFARKMRGEASVGEG